MWSFLKEWKKPRRFELTSLSIHLHLGKFTDFTIFSLYINLSICRFVIGNNYMPKMSSPFCLVPPQKMLIFSPLVCFDLFSWMLAVVSVLDVQYFEVLLMHHPSCQPPCVHFCHVRRTWHFTFRVCLSAPLQNPCQRSLGPNTGETKYSSGGVVSGSASFLQYSHSCYI